MLRIWHCQRALRGEIERLESRQMMAVVVMSEVWYDSYQSGHTSGYSFDLKAEETDGEFDVQFVSEKATVAQFVFSGNVPGNGLQIRVVDASGVADESWEIQSYGYPDSDIAFNALAIGEVQPGTTHFHITWQAAALGDANDDPIYYVEADALLGATLLSASAADPTSRLITIPIGDADPGEPTAEHGARYAWSGTTIDWSDLAFQQSDWVVEQFDIQGNQLESLDVSKSAETVTLLPTQLSNDIQRIAGVLISYDSATGSLRVDVAPSSTVMALEIKSPHAWFQVTTEYPWMNSAFNIAQADKLFRLDTHGFTELDFGAVLPTGLTRAELEGELQVAGAFGRGGNAQPIVLSIDGDITMEQAIESQFVTVLEGSTTVASTWLSYRSGMELPTESPALHPEESSGVRITYEPTWALAIDYRWAPDPRDVALPSDVRDLAIVELLFDDGTSRVVKHSLQPCEGTCHAEIQVPRWDRPVLLRITKQSQNSPLFIDQLAALPVVDEFAQSFDLTVPAGKAYEFSYRTIGGSFRTAELVDTEGQLVTSSDFFRLRGLDEGESHYTLRIATGNPLVSVGVRLLSDDSLGQVDSRLTRMKTDRVLELKTTWPIDLRTCSPEDIQIGDVATVERFLFISGTRLELQLSNDLPPGYSTLHVEPGRCVDTSGQPFDWDNYQLDHQPPQLISNSLKEHPVVPAGLVYLALQFDEPASVSFDSPRSEALRLLDENGLPATDTPATYYSRADGATVIVLGTLDPGNYQLEFTEHLIVGESHGNYQSLTDKFSFVVTQSNDFSPYDTNLDGVVDDADLRFVVQNRWFWIGMDAMQFDFNHDGSLDAQDDDAWRQEAWSYPAGDVNLDGHFDATDLALLASSAVNGLDVPADWIHGDFNGDGWFTTDDLVLAMQGGMRG
ncbi:MAG: hypothetical protein KDA92_06770 [Planctomycetales bacterium]|nr:hypothetical protein [Planctomycetales bacterium]